MRKLNHLFLTSLLAFASLSAQALDKPAAKAVTPITPTAAVVPALTISADGATVLSKDRKLVWMRCSIGQKWDANNCQEDPKKYDHRDAANQIKLMNMSGGYAGANDWRLPTAEELQSLVFCDQGYTLSTAIIKYEGNKQSAPLPQACEGEGYLRPTIDPIAFPRTARTWYWTSTPDTEKVINLWAISFATGSFTPISRHHQTVARAVRTVK